MELNKIDRAVIGVAGFLILAIFVMVIRPLFKKEK